MVFESKSMIAGRARSPATGSQGLGALCASAAWPARESGRQDGSKDTGMLGRQMADSARACDARRPNVRHANSWPAMNTRTYQDGRRWRGRSDCSQALEPRRSPVPTALSRVLPRQHDLLTRYWPNDLRPVCSQSSGQLDLCLAHTTNSHTNQFSPCLGQAKYHTAPVRMSNNSTRHVPPQFLNMLEIDTRVS